MFFVALFSLVGSAHGAPLAPSFVVHPVSTPDGPGVATTWSWPGGQPIGTVIAAGELGISDGWLKWLTVVGWDEPMEVPFTTWDAADEIVCDAGDRFHGTETEFHGTETEFHGTETEFHGTETEFHGTETEFHGTETEFHGTETELLPCGVPGVTDALRGASLALLRDAGVTGQGANAAVDAQVVVALGVLFR
jgi:hypothetical protein